MPTINKENHKNKMSFSSRISLIDLTKQLPFEIDNDIKKEICFAEALIISCGHYEGDYREKQSDKSWSCHESTLSEVSEEAKDFKRNDLKIPDTFDKDDVKEPSTTSSEHDFHFFFFPPCDVELKEDNSKTSVVLVDGLPAINPAAKPLQECTCNIDNKDQCTCFTKMPCSCGPKNKQPDPACLCSTLKDICICESGEIHTVCTCTESKVCLCHPDNKPRPVCICNKNTPCVCGGDPLPVCNCPSSSNCICTKPQAMPPCMCLKEKDCTCLTAACICEVKKACDCTPNDYEDPICNKNESKSICACDQLRECTCEESNSLCKCFPTKDCICENSEDCKCFHTCECIKPCICDYLSEQKEKNKDKCKCLDKSPGLYKELVCTCPPEPTEDNILKKVKVSKDGYRWCHQVDPHHTYFDYGYGRHEKIEHKEELIKKVHIKGLHDKLETETVCPIHGTPVPQYVQQRTKPSLDCCSAVGGISISVETLGDDKRKFLVQVVSHASKEGAKTGTKINSIIDCNLHTMEENRSEHITTVKGTKERRSYMAICESGYYNKVTRICGERDVVKRFYHTFEDAHDFLLEGANIVLMRYFGLRRYRGTVKTKTVLMGGLICESVYVCQGVSQAIVNGKPLFVVKVERHIIEPSGFIHQTLTVITLKGYMVSHEWADNCYILHLNPLLNVIPEKDVIEQHAPLRETWRNDLQLFSDYLDFKSQRTSEGGRYASENGALANTMRDYLQALLLLRPSDAFQFTRHYFGTALSTIDLPHDEYFDPCTKHVRYFYFEE